MSIDHERAAPGRAGFMRRRWAAALGASHAPTAAITRARVDEPMTSDPEASIAVVDRYRWMTAGSRTPFHVRARNLSTDTWPGPDRERPIRLGYRWLRPGSTDELSEGIRTAFPVAMGPCAEAIVAMIVDAPARPGRYMLEIDVVHEFVRWFECAVQVAIDVRAPREPPGSTFRTRRRGGSQQPIKQFPRSCDAALRAGTRRSASLVVFSRPACRRVDSRSRGSRGPRATGNVRREGHRRDLLGAVSPTAAGDGRPGSGRRSGLEHRLDDEPLRISVPGCPHHGCRARQHERRALSPEHRAVERSLHGPGKRRSGRPTARSRTTASPTRPGRTASASGTKENPSRWKGDDPGHGARGRSPERDHRLPEGRHRGRGAESVQGRRELGSIVSAF